MLLKEKVFYIHKAFGKLPHPKSGFTSLNEEFTNVWTVKPT